MVYFNLQTPLVVTNSRKDGEKARERFDLDTLDKNQKDIIYVFKIRDGMFSIGPSYLSGLFFKSTQVLSKEEFKKKYRFECSNKSILTSIDKFIEAEYNLDLPF